MVRLAALLALMPVAIGPLPAGGMTITATLCSGSTPRIIEIPLPSDEEQPVRHQPACHTLCPRKKIDPAQ